MKRLVFILIIATMCLSGCSIIKQTFTSSPGWTPTAADWDRALGVISQGGYNSDRDMTIKDLKR